MTVSSRPRPHPTHEPKIGIFTRLTTPEPYELLSLAEIDIVVLDAEHGIFDRASLSRCIQAARAGGLTAYVRVAGANLTDLQHVTGSGADGIIVPHVVDAAEMADIVAFVRGPALARAHAGATRASRYRETDWGAFQTDARGLMILAQVDDPAGVAAAPSMARIQHLDGVFLGRISLSLSLDGDQAALDVALDTVCDAFAGRTIGISLTDQNQAPRWQARGVDLFVVDSDQRLLLAGARRRLSDFRNALAPHAKGNP